MLPKQKLGRGLIGSLTVGLAIFRAVDAAQADMFSAGIVQDFERVTVEDGDDEASEVLGV